MAVHDVSSQWRVQNDSAARGWPDRSPVSSPSRTMTRPFTTVAAMPVLRCISRRPASGKSCATRNAHRAGQLAQKIE